MENKLQKKKTWSLLLLSSLLFSTFIISVYFMSSYNFTSIPLLRPRRESPRPLFVESKLRVASTSTDPIPRIAYLISGSKGDGESLKRTLRALYHPRNQYAVHLDLEAPAEERLELMSSVRDEPLFAKLGNVRVVVRSNLVTYRGPTMVTNTLHAAAILAKEGGDWDWFINLRDRKSVV